MFVPRDLKWRRTWFLKWRCGGTSNGGALCAVIQGPCAAWVQNPEPEPEKFHGWVTITTIINTMMIDEVMIIYQWQSWHHSKSGLLYQVESHQVGRDYLMMNTYWWFWWKWWYHIILSSSFSCNVEFASCWSKAKATSRPGQTLAMWNQLSKREINPSCNSIWRLANPL